MPSTRGTIPAPSARDTHIQLRARLFSSHYSSPLTRSVSTHISADRPVCASTVRRSVKRMDDYPARKGKRYPWVEQLFEDRNIQQYIHDTTITISERGRSHSFIVFCQNHVRLPLNTNLGQPWRGDIVVMRLGIGKLAGEVINLRAGDARRVKRVIDRFLTRAKQGKRFRLSPKMFA